MHFTVKSLIELIDGDVSDATRRRLEEHLAGCGACRDREREVRRVMRALASDRLLEPPADSVETALRAFPRRDSADRPRWARGLPERLASLVFDSLANPRQAFAGARTGAVARRLRFETDQIELDALIEVEGERRRLIGQVLSLGKTPQPVKGAPYYVLAAGTTVGEGETGTHGDIAAASVPSGEFEIRMGVKGRVYVFGIPDPGAEVPED